MARATSTDGAKQANSAEHQDSGDETAVKEVAPFLRSLRRMLDHESPRIMRWTTDGKAFEIHDMAAMTGYVLPKYFKHRKYASFQRQLNYFHFRKWTKSRAVVCTFSNAFFQRDQPALTWRITRKRALSPASTSNSLSLSPQAERKSPRVQADSPSPSPALQIVKQLEPVVKVEATVQTEQEPVAADEDASLAWIDALYPSLELELMEEEQQSWSAGRGLTPNDCRFSTMVLSSGCTSL
ncbi:hypothetical protein BBJ28_00019334 [Nothophytophthora sp. Chile5]|nr:hypothetical protein BBJ28_00019334 [Nothophytophthora sp. Chile5]